MASSGATSSSGERLQQLCADFAKLLQDSKHCVFYTGAGVSTSAAIPDFRSPSGLYEQFKNNGTVPRCVDITAVRPAFTHMAIKALVDANYVRHVVSQNCDGLHLRSGLPNEKLSEVHGNMFVEMCLYCEPPSTFVRNFDTTLGTGFRRHKVDGAEQRPCEKCGKHEFLHDSVVHCGEFARYEASPPYRWPEAGENASRADLIVCIGTSLQVLKSYKSLWTVLTKRKAGKPLAKLVILNIGPTAKDKQANLIINLNCDEVFRETCRILGIQVSDYNPNHDPIHLAGMLFGSSGVFRSPSQPKIAPISSSPTSSMPGWMRATVDQLRRAREKAQRSRRVTVFGSRKKSKKRKNVSNEN